MANAQRNRWNTLGKVLTLVSVLMFVLFPLLSYTAKNLAYLCLLAIPMVLYWASRWATRIVRRKRIYSYSYSSLFPLKVHIAPDAHRINDMFIHGKIYIIDGHTAYLGSLNFTESGTKYNYETRVRITDVDAVQKIDAEFEELYNHETLVFIGIEDWGHHLFMEAKN